MSYYSEKRLRFFNDPVDEEILDLLDRIELKLADLSVMRAEIVALQGQLMELRDRRGELYPPPKSN